MGDFNYAAGVAIGLGNKARALQGNLAQANANIDYANQIIAQRNGEIANLQADVNALKAEIERLKWELLLEKAHAEGMKAYRDELRRGAPNNPAEGPSGQFYKSGNPKPWAGIMYDREFDRILREARIFDPENYRA